MFSSLVWIRNLIDREKKKSREKEREDRKKEIEKDIFY